MKLPTYESPALERHIPEQNVGAEGRAMAQFGQVVGQAFEQAYEQESVTEYNKAIADFKNFQSELVASYDQNAYMQADKIGGLATKENIDEFAVKDADGNPTGEVEQLVRTDKVMSEHYKQETEKVYKAMLSGFRTAKGRNSFREAYEYKIRPQGQAAIDASALETKRSMNRAEFVTDDLPKLIKAGDAEATEEAIELTVAAGILSPEEGIKLTAEAINQITTNEYAAFAADPDTTAGELEARKAEIPDDTDLTPEQALKLDQDYQKAIYADHSNQVDGAIIDRDYNRLSALKAEYSEGYEGSMTEGQRLTLIKRIESTVDGWAAESAAYDKYEAESAQRDLDTMIDMARDGRISPDLLAQEAPELAEKAFEGGMTTKTERALHDRLVTTLQSVDAYTKLSRMPVANAASAMDDIRSRVDSAETAILADDLIKFNDDLTTRKTDDTLQAAVTAGIVDEADVPPLDYSSPEALAETLSQRVDAGRRAASHYGVPGQILDPGTQIALGEAYDAADTPGKLSLISTITKSIPRVDERVMAFNELSESTNNYTHVAGIIDANGSTKSAQDALAGYEFRHSEDGQRQLELLGWDKTEQRDSALSLTERAVQLFPGQSGPMVDASLDMASLWIARGMEPKKAVQRALDRISGGEVKGSGTDHINKPPTIGMGTNDFRRQQQGISNAYFESIGWDYDENPRNLVARGQVVFLDHGSGERGKYNLWDTRTNQAIGDENGVPVVVTWSERGTDAGEQGIIDRNMRALGIQAPEINDPKWQDETARRQLRKEESKRRREARKKERAEARPDIDWFGDMGGQTGSFAP